MALFDNSGADLQVTESGGTANGNAGDPNAGGTLTIVGPETFTGTSPLVGTYGTFTFDTGTGAWTYTIDEALADTIPAGQTPTDTLTVTADDATTYDIVVNVVGANDDAAITGTDTGAVTEDDAINTASGTLIVTDADGGENELAPVAAGTSGDNGHGTFEVLANGQWTYTLNNADPQVQAIPAGDTLTDTITVFSEDGTDSQIVTVTITGANDSATISGTDTGDVTEDGTLTATGTLIVTDADTGENELAPVVAGTAGDNGHGTFEVLANGQWTYTLNNADPLVQALPDGDTLTDTITVLSEDGTDSHIVTVTITGANDVATISGTDTGDVTEDGALTATGTLTVSDIDTGENELDPVVAGTAGDNGHGTFEVLANGQWTYTLNNADASVQALPDGDTLTDTITVYSEDGTDSHVVTVTITGTNDAATISGTDTGDVAEDGTLTATGTLIVTDADTGENELAPIVAGTAGDNGHGTFEVLANGQWTYTLNNADASVQALPDGDTLTDTITVFSEDGTASQDVTVTITGTNDAAVISGTDTGSVREDNILTATGTLIVTDADTGENEVDPIVAGTAGDNGYGTFEVQANGQWTYTLDNANPAVQALATGATLTDTITVLSEDGTDSQVITITIDGDNDPAVITGTSTGSVTEDVALTATGTLVVTDVDTGENELVPVAAGTAGDSAHGTFEVLANGQWTYTLNNADAAVQALPAGDTLTDTITVSSEDGSDTQVITVTITGTNDVPTLGGDVAGAVSEDAGATLTDSGVLTIADTDTGESAFAVQAGTVGSNGHGSFDLAANGSWTYSADNSQLAIQQLGAGATLTDSFTAVSADGSASETVTVTITGVNDNPVANDDLGGATDSGLAVQLDVLANDTDVDLGDSLIVSGATVATGLGTVSIASDGLSITYDPGSAYDYLANGETAVVTIDYMIDDGNGGTAMATAEVTVTGGNEAPVIVAPTDALAILTELADHAPQENVLDHGVSGTVSFSDADTSDTHTASFVAQAGSYLGTFSISPNVNQVDGNVGWSFTVSDALLNSLGQGEVLKQYYDVTIDDGNGGTVTQTVEIDLIGTNDAAHLSSANVVVQQGDDPLTVTDQLTITDEDGPALFVAQSSTAGLYGHFSIATDGSWTYQADQAYAGLGEGDFLSDVFTVLAEDGTPTTVSVTIAGVDDPAVAHQDLFTTDEATAFGAGLNLFADNGSGADEASEGGTLEISAVNGSAALVGQKFQLASGAQVTVNADGTFSYDPNHAFDSLTGASGAGNQFGFDSFTYTLAGGSTATAFVNIQGVSSAEDVIMGNGLDNSLTGTSTNDFFMLNQAGHDSASGLGGNDGFYFGGYFDSTDLVDGGDGIDTLAIQGNINAALGDVRNVEVLLALSGSDTRFGETGDQSYSYDLVAGDHVVAAGETLTVVGTGLQAGENLHFDGSAETDGNFRIFGGQGDDVLIGGAGSDGFFFGADGNLNGADHVDGGAGVDTLALRGNYVGADAVVLQDGSFANVEVLALLSGHTNEFSGQVVPGGYDYDVTMADGNVAAGGRLDVNAARLASDESFRFDGRAETDGSFRILSGAGDDILFGGAQADTLYGGGGADHLEGGAGADVYFYRSASDSTSTAYDTITGFDYREDRLDMPGGGARAFTQAAEGNLSTGSFDTDLAAAMDGVLGTGQAALFTATGGSLAGHVFAVVDANGVAGYQAGEDFVIEFAAPVVPIDPHATVIG